MTTWQYVIFIRCKIDEKKHTVYVWLQMKACIFYGT